MVPLLAHLEPLLPALKAQGLEVYPSGLQLHTHSRNGKTQKLLRIDTAGILDVRKPSRWLQALLQMGFQEVERTAGPYAQIVLRKGHLAVKVDAPTDPVEAARGAQAYATRCAAQAAAAIATEVPA